MTNSQENIGSPIKQFIEKTRKETIAGLDDWELKAPIEVELSTIVKGKVGGGLDIQVINFGAKVEAEQIHKVRLSIGPVEEIQKRERIAIINALDKQPNIALKKYFEV